MRKYNEKKILTDVVCNKCKKHVAVHDGCLKDSFVHMDYAFGYFSSKDGMVHHFDLCESCYDEMINAFSIPVEITENTELL